MIGSNFQSLAENKRRQLFTIREITRRNLREETEMQPVLKYFSLATIVILIEVATTNELTTIHLRIEGVDKTLYEGPIQTIGAAVTTSLGGKHRCDGTNNNVHAIPGPTATGALDSAAKRAGFTWDG